jgi:hypothetical protein
MRWNKREKKNLIRLVKSGQYTYFEIAEQMNRPRNSIAAMASKMGLKNPTYRLRKTKHKHLRMPVFEYYQNHSAEETQKHFNISPSEFKSILTVGYKIPELLHLRKDTRRGDKWSKMEKIFLLRHSGLQPREWIAKKLNRGTMHSVKEELKRLRIKSRYIHGLPQRYANILLGFELEGIKTKAGPNGCGSDLRYIVVPWIVLNRRICNRKDIKPAIKIAVRSLSKFQKWIFEGQNNNQIIKTLKRNARKK